MQQEVTKKLEESSKNVELIRDKINQLSRTKATKHGQGYSLTGFLILYTSNILFNIIILSFYYIILYYITNFFLYFIVQLNDLICNLILLSIIN